MLNEIKKQGEIDLQFLTFCVKPEIVDNQVWKMAFENDNCVYGLCLAFGWQGGTIHQVIDAIKVNQKKMAI